MQMMPILESGEETLVGGQAVMEGVMMRAPHSYCVAVRKPSGEIVTEEMPLARMSEQYPIFKLPIFRGVGTLYQALKLGGRALKFSAAAALDEPGKEKEPVKEVPGWVMALPIIFSLAFFVFAYKFVPLFLVTRLSEWYPSLSGRIAFNSVDGVIRLAILLALLLRFRGSRTSGASSNITEPSMKSCSITNRASPSAVPTAQSFTTFHPRCGTSFLFVVFVLAIPIYTVLPFDGFAAKLARA